MLTRLRAGAFAFALSSSASNSGMPDAARVLPAPAGGGLTFGVPRQYFFDRLEPGVRQSVDLAIARVIDAGYTVRDTTISGAEYTPDVYLHICLPEASCHHAASLSEHADGYSPGVRLRLEMGRYILAEDYVRAMRDA